MDWETLIDEHGAKLILYARQWCDTHAEAEEAVQTVLVSLLRKRQGESPVPPGVLFKAVKHAAIDAVSENTRPLKRVRVRSPYLFPRAMMMNARNSSSVRLKHSRPINARSLS